MKGVESGPRAETVEKQIFEVLSSYYCDRGGWPGDWDDLRTFQAARRADASFMDLVKNASLESNRAIVVTLTYDNEAGAQRKVSFIAPPSCQAIQDKGLVSIAGGRISFRLLEGTTLMSGQKMKEYWRNPPFPDAAWKGGGDVVIALRFGDVEVAPSELGAFAQSIAEAYEASVPSLVWIQKRDSSDAPLKVLEHEFESDSSRGRIVNYVLSTSFDNRLLAITVLGPAANAQDVERAATAVRSTLIIR